MVKSRETGEFGPLETVESVLSQHPSPRQQARVDDWLASAIYGDEAQVRAQLEELVDRTGADEVMSTASTFADADRDASDAALVAALAT